MHKQVTIERFLATETWTLMPRKEGDMQHFVVLVIVVCVNVLQDEMVCGRERYEQEFAFQHGD